MDDGHRKAFRALLVDITIRFFTHYCQVVDCGHVLNLVMMDIQHVPFYSISVDSRLETCAKRDHFCPQLSKLSIVN